MCFIIYSVYRMSCEKWSLPKTMLKWEVKRNLWNFLPFFPPIPGELEKQGSIVGSVYAITFNG